MIYFSHKDFKVEVIDDPTYKVGFSNNKIAYNSIFQHPTDQDYGPVSQHGIMVYRDGGLYINAIIIASGGGTGVNSGAGLLDENKLIVRCCNKVFSFDLPELKLNWIKAVDGATCFSIEKYQDTYITHGETSISRLTKDGEILWQVEASDIFVNISNHGDTFKMLDTHIQLMDWNGNRYILSYDGQIQDDLNNPVNKEIEINMKGSIINQLAWTTKKPWWKFW